jgi:hypothetical protein
MYVCENSYVIVNTSFFHGSASHHGGVPVEVTEESLGRMQEDIKVRCTAFF